MHENGATAGQGVVWALRFFSHNCFSFMRKRGNVPTGRCLGRIHNRLSYLMKTGQRLYKALFGLCDFILCIHNRFTPVVNTGQRSNGALFGLCCVGHNHLNRKVRLGGLPVSPHLGSAKGAYRRSEQVPTVAFNPKVHTGGVGRLGGDRGGQPFGPSHRKLLS